MDNETRKRIEDMRDMIDTCLEQSGDKWENDYHLVLEKADDLLAAIQRTSK